MKWLRKVMHDYVDLWFEHPIAMFIGTVVGHVIATHFFPPGVTR